MIKKSKFIKILGFKRFFRSKLVKNLIIRSKFIKILVIRSEFKGFKVKISQNFGKQNKSIKIREIFITI